MNSKDVNYEIINVVGSDENGEPFDHSHGLAEHVFDTSLINATISGKPMVIDLKFVIDKNPVIIPIPFISVLYGTDMTAGGTRMKFDNQSNFDYSLNFSKNDSQNYKTSLKNFVNHGSTEKAIQMWNNLKNNDLSDDDNLIKNLLPIVKVNSNQYNNFLCHTLAMEYMLAVKNNNKELSNSIAEIDIMKEFDLSSFEDNSNQKNNGFVFNMTGNRMDNMHLVKFGNKLYSFGLQPRDKNDNTFFDRFNDKNYLRMYNIIDNSLEAISEYDGYTPSLPNNEN